MYVVFVYLEHNSFM